MISVQNLEFSYDEKSNFTLRCDEFIAQPSKLTCVIGRNGSGKSTMLKLIGRILEPVRGTITLKGKNITAYTNKEIRELIGWIDSSMFNALVEELYVLDHLALALYLSNVKIPFFYRNIEFNNFLDTKSNSNNILNELLNSKIGNLSSGQRQNVTIALTSLAENKILLTDESTANLDIYYSRLFFKKMKKISKLNSSTVVIITHDILLAAEFGDEIYFIDEGNIYKINFEDDDITSRIKRCKSKIISSYETK
jgi:iron complex transport system ATP-binding protein